MHEPLVLRDQKSPTDHRHLSVTIQPDGALRIVGHDLGDGVERALGNGMREYEWITEVAAADVQSVLDALGGERGANPLDVIATSCMHNPSRLENTIRALGIKPKFWSRMA
ncbi:MAG TPA: hypothetical protein VFQ53_19315 [Kofleriaceae bacterium]|nr:hypothetical protein [Kofleriaceae bacterium]